MRPEVFLVLAPTVADRVATVDVILCFGPAGLRRGNAEAQIWPDPSASGVWGWMRGELENAARLAERRKTSAAPSTFHCQLAPLPYARVYGFAKNDPGNKIDSKAFRRWLFLKCCRACCNKPSDGGLSCHFT